jgi:hypothetical protein
VQAFAVVALTFLLGVWEHRDALRAGFWADDYLSAAMLDGTYPSPRAAWDHFRFADGSRGDRQRLVDFGYYPWWTHPDFRLSMFRPLPSLLMTADFAVFGSDSRAHHWHSFLWWGLMLASVAALLHALLPRGAAALALLCFAIDESHTIPLVWLSNRSLLVATTFACCGLVAHVYWRRSGFGSLRACSVVCFALALASGEYALAMFGYLLCFEFGSRFPGPSRGRALAPAAVLCAAFFALFVAFGYGTAHSGLYANPLRAPLFYLERLASGLPVLLGDITLGIPADWWSFGSPLIEKLVASHVLSASAAAKLPSFHVLQIALGGLGTLLALALLLWLRRRLEREHARALIWLSAGAVLGLLPVLASFLTTRLVLPASIGAAALFGSACAYALRALRSTPLRRAHVLLGLTLLTAVIAYVHGYRTWVTSTQSTDLYSTAARARSKWPMAAPLDDEHIVGQRVIMVAAGDANDAPYLPFVRAAFHKPLPHGFRLLSGALGEHELRRIDEHTLELQVLESFGLEASVVGSLTRSYDDRVLPGERFAVAGMQVEVLETSAGQPTRMRFTFDVPLEDPSLVWLQSTPRGLTRLTLPPPGATLRLPRPAMPM